jgi:peptidoglycan/LPS O-acetylase OafA/YrhL
LGHWRGHACWHRYMLLEDIFRALARTWYQSLIFLTGGSRPSSFQHAPAKPESAPGFQGACNQNSTTSPKLADGVLCRFTWVPFFLMLSGFVLSHAALAHGESAQHMESVCCVARTRRFVWKRLAGIYPLYAVALASSAFLAIAQVVSYVILPHISCPLRVCGLVRSAVAFPLAHLRLKRRS